MDAALNLVECFIYGIVFFIVYREVVNPNASLERSESEPSEQPPPMYYINSGAELSIQDELSKHPNGNNENNIHQF